MKRTSLLFALLSLPLQSPEAWKHEKFGSVPQNQVRYEATALSVQVERSSSPLFFTLSAPAKVSAVRAQGTVSALPQLKTDRNEGEKGNDDYALRVGLVYEGEDGPNWLQRWLAPGWIRRLIALSPERGFSRVIFHVLSQRTPPGSSVETGSSRWITGISAQQLTAPGNFSFDSPATHPEKVFGVWIQADGDDTASSFLTQIQSLELVTETP